MGIHGVTTIMKNDPARFCESFMLNWDGPEQGNIALLIDAMSLLHYLASSSARKDYLDLSLVRKSTSEYTKSLLKVVGQSGSVHFFFDGLNPLSKVTSQVERYSKQAMLAEKMAQGHQPAAKDRIIHHLAQWAFQEAIEEMIEETHFPEPQRLHIHRPKHGEGEAHINFWISQNGSSYSKIAVISEDSDFLIYDSCPGFIPPRSIKIEVHNGAFCLQGQLFSRNKFLKAFFGGIPHVDRLAMATLATLAGCDYCPTTGKPQQLVDKCRWKIIQSDIAGLRQKHRNNPAAASAATAVARSIAHYMERAGPDHWLDLMLQVNSEEPATLRSIIESVLEVYYNELSIGNPDDDKNPILVDVRRLLCTGILYCYPVAEESAGHDILNSNRKDLHTRKRDRENSLVDSIVVNTSAYAIVPLPPLTTQLFHWNNQSSMWLFPHFRQIRARLYVIIHNFIKKRGMNGIRNFTLSERWSQDDYTSYVVEYAREGKGNHIRMAERFIKVPHHNKVSSGLFPDMLDDTNDTILFERWLILCLTGTGKLLPPDRLKSGDKYGTALMASLMLPFNLAALLLLAATAPRLDGLELSFTMTEAATDEVDLTLPILGIAVHHAQLCTQTLAQLFPKASSGLLHLNTPINHIFDYRTVSLVWNCIRLGRNLEDLPDQECFSAEDSNVQEYLDDTFTLLLGCRPPTDMNWATAIQTWKREVMVLWELWWHVFSLEDLRE